MSADGLPGGGAPPWWRPRASGRAGDEGHGMYLEPEALKTKLPSTCLKSRYRVTLVCTRILTSLPAEEAAPRPTGTHGQDRARGESVRRVAVRRAGRSAPGARTASHDELGDEVDVVVAVLAEEAEELRRRVLVAHELLVQVLTGEQRAWCGCRCALQVCWPSASFPTDWHAP